MTLCGELVGNCVNETGEVVSSSWDVDGLEEVHEELPNPLRVIIGQGTNDGWEFGSCIGDDEFGLLRRRYGADKEGRGKRLAQMMVQ